MVVNSKENVLGVGFIQTLTGVKINILRIYIFVEYYLKYGLDMCTDYYLSYLKKTGAFF